MTSRPNTRDAISRRAMLAGTAAAAVLTSSVAVAAAAKEGSIQDLYDTWKAAKEEDERCNEAVNEQLDAIAEEYGSYFPLVQYGIYRDADGCEQPLYLSWPHEVEKVTAAQMMLCPKAGERQRKMLHEALAREKEVLCRLRQERDLDRLSEASEAATWAEGAAWERLVAARATTPQEAALKIMAALEYGPSEVTETGDLVGQGIASALEDLRRMDAGA